MTSLPLSDGGEGFAEVVGDLIGGTEISLVVTGPLGEKAHAGYRISDDGRIAVIEMASAAGRALLPHPRGEEPVVASTRGVGELIVDAGRRGSERIIVGCGGSASTDGGLGALSVIDEQGGLGDVDLVIATDVTTRYLDAARIFGPQKGASPEQVEILSLRLGHAASLLRDRYGIDVVGVDRSGAAGGLAGGLHALGGVLTSGFEVICSLTGLDQLLAEADLVITGEGLVDASTLEGKAVASLIDHCPESVPVLIIAGDVEHDASRRIAASRGGEVDVLSLTELFGRTHSVDHAFDALHEATLEALASR